MNKIKGLMAGLLCASALLGSASPASAVLIDSFVTAQTASVDGVPVLTDFVSGVAVTAIGGNRDIFVTKTAGSDGDRIRARTNPIGEDKLRVSLDDGVRGLTQIQWDGNNATSIINASGLGGISLLADGSVAFALGVSGSDIGGPVHVTVYEQGAIGNFLTGTFTIPSPGIQFPETSI